MFSESRTQDVLILRRQTRSATRWLYIWSHRDPIQSPRAQPTKYPISWSWPVVMTMLYLGMNQCCHLPQREVRMPSTASHSWNS